MSSTYETSCGCELQRSEMVKKNGRLVCTEHGGVVEAVRIICKTPNCGKKKRVNFRNGRGTMFCKECQAARTKLLHKARGERQTARGKERREQERQLVLALEILCEYPAEHRGKNRIPRNCAMCGGITYKGRTYKKDVYCRPCKLQRESDYQKKYVRPNMPVESYGSESKLWPPAARLFDCRFVSRCLDDVVAGTAKDCKTCSRYWPKSESGMGYDQQFDHGLGGNVPLRVLSGITKFVSVGG